MPGVEKNLCKVVKEKEQHENVLSGETNPEPESGLVGFQRLEGE